MITETWCHKDITEAFLTIENYEVSPELRLDRADTAQGRGGGLIVYVKKGLQVFKIVDEVNFHQYLAFRVYDLSFYVVNRSPNAPPAAMTNLVELVRGAHKNCVIIGDINLPEVDWDLAQTRGRAVPLLETMEDRFMSQQVDFPTQVGGTILDIVITDIPDRFVETTPGPVLGSSDHVAIIASIGISNREQLSRRMVFNWRKANITGMKAEMASAQWREVFRSCDAEEMWVAFKSRLLMAMNNHVPEKPVSPLGRPPWFTREISAALKRKQRLWREARQTGNTASYKEAEKLVKQMIRRRKRSFEKRLAAGGPSNKRPFYAYVKRRTKSRPSVGPLRNGNGSTVTDDGEMAAMLNEYFCSVFTKGQGQPAVAASTVTATIGQLQITPAMVSKRIDKLRPEAAAGPDKIGPQLLQALKEEVSAPLAAIFNESLSSGLVPTDWRRANVTPIYKKGSKADPGNYRPVLLTSVCCKLLEGIIKERLVAHLETNNLILSSQHGFMKVRSCATNLLEFLETATAVLDEGNPFDIVYLDFAKAFDKVPRAPLVSKLKSMGLSGPILSWIENWLTDRRH